MLALTGVGEHGALWLAIAGAGAAVDPAGRSIYRRAARTVLVAYGVNTAIKYTIRRRRPLLPGLPPLTPTVSGLSYPSAHASTSFAGARVLSARIPAAPLNALAAAVALSRPYLGVHYPSDALAGAVLGRAVATLVP